MPGDVVVEVALLMEVVDLFGEALVDGQAVVTLGFRQKGFQGLVFPGIHVSPLSSLSQGVHQQNDVEFFVNCVF